MKISLSKFNTLMLLASLVAVLALTGCAGVKNTMRLSGKDSAWNPVEKLKAEKEKESEPAEPATMVVTWKGSVYETVGATTRGFGGRIFFHDDANNSVEADGELTVYGFDDTNKKAGDASADKKFVFRASEFQTHKSDSGLGISYSIWIPWEKVGGYRKSISLIPIFKTTKGKILKGGQSVNVLHGKTPEQQLSNNGIYKVLGSSPAVLSQASFNSDSRSQNQGVVPASFQEDTPAEQQNKIKTSTISLTPSMARRIEANRKVSAEKSEPITRSEDLSLEQVRRMISEQQNSSPVSTGQVSEKKHQASQRQTFGSPGSFK